MHPSKRKSDSWHNQRDANRPGWHAAYMTAEQAGTELPT
jgi:hypothetical protein